jgi:hypothetical protein
MKQDKWKVGKWENDRNVGTMSLMNLSGLEEATMRLCKRVMQERVRQKFELVTQVEGDDTIWVL